MKSNFSGLKLKIIGNLLISVLIAAGIGLLIWNIFIDGIFQDPFARAFISLCLGMKMDHESAQQLYQHVFRNNKTLFMSIGFFILLMICIYRSMTKFTKYLNEVGAGIDNILNDSSEIIELPEELKPVETKLNTIKTTLQKRQYDAAQSEQRKNDLVVYLAHDLKTPLTSIIAYLSLLNEAPDMPVEQRAKYTGIALEKAVRLGELIQEFFEITRYNLQNIVLELDEIDISMMLEQMVDEISPLFLPKNISYKTEIEEELIVRADPDRIARVFDNLLRNAIAYSRENTTLTVIAEKTDHGVEIAFRNQGAEIPKDKLDMIFEKFYRLDASRSSKTGGAGLGLAIAKEIMEAHKGWIRADSNQEYTEFRVCIPLNLRYQGPAAK